MKAFYTYLWLREDGTPYYVGKGYGVRAFAKEGHHQSPPTKDRILVQEFPDETAAIAAEIFLISFYGRIDSGTGCLRNMTDGGQGVSGRKLPYRPLSAEHREKIRLSLIGNKRSLGYKHSEEAKRNMSVGCSKVKRPWASERCRQMGFDKKGKPWSEARKAAQRKKVV